MTVDYVREVVVSFSVTNSAVWDLWLISRQIVFLNWSVQKWLKIQSLEPVLSQIRCVCVVPWVTQTACCFLAELWFLDQSCKSHAVQISVLRYLLARYQASGAAKLCPRRRSCLRCCPWSLPTPVRASGCFCVLGPVCPHQIWPQE